MKSFNIWDSFNIFNGFNRLYTVPHSEKNYGTVLLHSTALHNPI